MVSIKDFPLTTNGLIKFTPKLGNLLKKIADNYGEKKSAGSLTFLTHMTHVKDILLFMPSQCNVKGEKMLIWCCHTDFLST